MVKYPHYRSTIWGFLFGLGCLIIGSHLTTGSHIAAQETLDEALGAPLHQQDPFDRITLNKANRGVEIDVYPLPSLDRRQSVDSVIGMTFRIRRRQDPPDRLYDIAGSQIEKIEFFHELLREEARRLIDANQLDEAFPYLDRLHGEFPETPELQPLIEQFYIADAVQLFRNKRYDEALLALDQVFTLNPHRPGLARYLQSVLGEVIQIEFDKGDFSSARRSASYARQRYGAVTEAIVKQWEAKLKETSSGQLALAKELFAEGKPTPALAASRQAMRTWPQLEGAAQLNRQILRQYPRVMVGVTQRYVNSETLEPPPPKSLNWATRRSEALIRRPLIEFVDFTADGGQYASPLGTLKVSPDRRQITLRIEDDRGVTAVGYKVARSLLKLADHREDQFDQRWAEFFGSVYVPAPNTVEISLTRRTLRPEALLPTPRLQPEDPLAALFAGPYQLSATSDVRATTYKLRVQSQSQSSRPQEIVEQYFNDPNAAANALLRGEIDVLDRVYPADLRRLSANPEIRIVPYRIPTIHFLVVNGRQLLLRRATFRRGILYAINRDGFVRDELLAGDARLTAQMLTGPLPRGVSDDDSLGYAYDRLIQPRAFDPSLGFVLLRLAQAQLQQQTQNSTDEDSLVERKPGAEKVDLLEMAASVEAERATPFPPLVLAFPDSSIAKAASSAIAADLRRVGFEVTLRGLESGFIRPQDGAWDLLYVEATLEEPFIDIPDLIVGENLLGDQSGVLWQAVRVLQEADDWDHVRDQFALVHKLVYDHTPLIPLWQIVEHLAHRDQLDGLGSRPASLYQNVDRWRLNP